MKIKSLHLSIFVFLMSGLVCVFSNNEVSAQVPQTKRSEQDSFLKNIRAKKRNNDLQKARQQKRKSDSSSEWNLRIRHQIGKYNQEEGENRSNYKKDVTDVKIWSVIIHRIGFSNLKQHYFSIKDWCWGSCWHSQDYYQYISYNTESTILTYTFGQKHTLTVGTTIDIKGDINVGDRRNSPNDIINYSSTNVETSYSNLINYIDTITLGFEFYGIEFLIGTGKQDFKFKELKCNTTDCQRTADEIYSQSEITDYWIDFGLGIVF